jgi:predicted acetyltransferase
MNTKEAVKALWKLCFEEEEESFVDMYFNLRYTDEVNMAVRIGNRIISAFQMIPYPMSFCGTNISTAYISGACTHPSYRRRGIMSGLLRRAFGRMYSGGVFISTLIPANAHLVDYYVGMGYAPVFKGSKRTLLLAEVPPTDASVSIEYTEEYREDVYTYLNEKMMQRPCCIQHTETDFKIVLADLFLFKDKVFYAVGQDKKVAGVALAKADGDTLYFNELLAESEEVENELLRQAGINCGCTQLQITTPFGMARIINAKGVLDLYAAANPEIDMSIELHDSFLPSNNGQYYLCGGNCTVDRKLQDSSSPLTISELTERIMEGMQPSMSLMLSE